MGGDDDDVVAAQGVLDGLSLVAVELVDAAFVQRCVEGGVQRSGDGRVARRRRGQGAPGGDVGHKALVAAQVGEDVGEGHEV